MIPGTAADRLQDEADYPKGGSRGFKTALPERLSMKVSGYFEEEASVTAGALSVSHDAGIQAVCEQGRWHS